MEPLGINQDVCRNGNPNAGVEANIEVLPFKMGTPDFHKKSATRLKILLNVCRGLHSISHNAVSVQLSHGCESTRMLACRVQILSE
jgi:hypothetical protein